MAEKKNKYKYGQHEMDYDFLLHNMGTNLQNYMKHQDWDEEKRKKFELAHETYTAALRGSMNDNPGRFYSKDSGTFVDTLGEIGGDDEVNLEYVKYLNQVANVIVSKLGSKKSDGKKKFDITKHGFVNHWAREATGGAGGDVDIAPYLNMDVFDEATGKRGRANRTAYLAELLEKYRDNLSEDYDFTDSAFGSREGYIGKLNSLISSLRDRPEWNDEDLRSLQSVGIGKNWYDGFFTDKKDLISSDLKEESELERKARESSEARQRRERDELLQSQILDDEAAEYFSNYSRNNPFKSSISRIVVPSYNLAGMEHVLSLKYGIDIGNKEALSNAAREYIDFRGLNDAIRGIIKYRKPNTGEDITDARIANHLDYAAQNNFFTDSLGDNYYVVPESYNYDNWTYIAYNPITKLYEERSMLDNDTQRAKAYEEYKKNPDKYRKHQLGGAIKIREENAKKVLENKTKQEKEIKERGADKVKAELRKPSEDFSATDLARLTAIGLDVTSLLSSFAPGVGTAVSAGTGIASSLTNFGADWAEDGLDWNDGKNLLVNLGADLVGLVPGFGSAGKAGKITKALVKWAPRIMVALQVKNALSEDALASWKKIGTDEKLTVDDWRNIASGITAVAGVGRMTAGLLKANDMRNRAKTGDSAITTKSGKQIRVNDDLLKAIKEAKDLDSANAALRKVKGAEGEELASTFLTKWYNPYSYLGRPKVHDHYDFSRLRGTMYDRGKYVGDSWWYERSKTANLGFIDWSKFKLNPYNYFNRNLSNLSVTRNTPLLGLPSPRRFRLSQKGISAEDLNKRGIYKQGGVLDFNKIRKALSGMEFTIEGKKVKGNNNLFSALTYDFLNAKRMGHYKGLDGKLKYQESYDDATDEISPGNGKYDPRVGANMFESSDLYKAWYGRLMSDPLLAEHWAREYVNMNPTTSKYLNSWFQDGKFNNDSFKKTTLPTDGINGIGHDFYVGNAYQIEGLEGNYYGGLLDGYELISENPNTDNPYAKVYTMRKKAESSLEPVVLSDNSKQTNPLVDKNPSGDKKSSTKSNILGGLLKNPTLTYGLPRALYADKMNRKMTDLAKDAIKPSLIDPVEHHRSIYGDLRAKVEGLLAAAQLTSAAAKPLTSDGNLQTAALFEAANKGLEYIHLGNAKDDMHLRQTSEMAWQLEKENKNNRHLAAMANRLEMLKASSNKAALESAYLSKKHNIWDTFGQLLEYDVRTKLAENKARNEAALMADILDEAKFNLELYTSLTPAEKELLLQINTGSITAEEALKADAYLSLTAKMTDVTELLRNKHFGISSPYSNVRSIYYSRNTNPTITVSNPVISDKKGGKIKDADRFMKAVLEAIRRNDKMIERLAKQTYKYPDKV